MFALTRFVRALSCNAILLQSMGMARKTFKAKLEHSGVPGTWSTVTIPFNVEKMFGSRARVAVKGTVNGAPYRGSAMPRGDGSHFLVVNITESRRLRG
jgi:hypothetical protein